MGESAPVRPERALIAAYDPSLFLPLARTLTKHSVELWATSGTARRLSSEGLPARSTEELTGIGAWFGGRVKTLHPAIFGGILASREGEGARELKERGIAPFDLVAVHLYPFEAARTATPPKGVEELTELIDIGGVSLLRAAAKNHRWVVSISSPEDAEKVAREMDAHEGRLSFETRRELAQRTFLHTATYDAQVSSWLAGNGGTDGPDALIVASRVDGEKMRYGENQHQKAWTYSLAHQAHPMQPWPLTVVKGEALSYNNFLDVDNSVAIVNCFSDPAAAVVKHGTPCGVATGKSLVEALNAALETDAVARYGCVIALNRVVDDALVQALTGTFVDLLAAPGFTPSALERLTKRAKLKAVRFGEGLEGLLRSKRYEARSAAGRLLIQESDQKALEPSALRQVTRRAATPEEIQSLKFAWSVVRHVRSNAIVLARGSRTVGIGGGQTSRVGAVREAVEVAEARSKGAVMSSDAYFPFADGLETAAKAGVTAVIQPGGSIRDDEVIAAADRAGMAMYFTGWRIFRH